MNTNTQPANHPHNSLCVAHVSRATHGSASWVEIDQHTYRVTGHASQTPWLAPGDKVLCYASNQDTIIIDKIENSAHTPKQCFEFNTDKQLQLTLDKIHIRLTTEGGFQAHCQQMNWTCEKPMILKGKPIELNPTS